MEVKVEEKITEKTGNTMKFHLNSSGEGTTGLTLSEFKPVLPVDDSLETRLQEKDVWSSTDKKLLKKNLPERNSDAKMVQQNPIQRKKTTASLEDESRKMVGGKVVVIDRVVGKKRTWTSDLRLAFVCRQAIGEGGAWL